jgi:hypothetical protein
MSFSIFNNDIPYHKYNNRKVINKIKIIRMLLDKNPKSRKIEKLKFQIYLMMKNLIVKNINNYLKYSQNSSVADMANTSLEMEAEAYIIVDNCIKQFQYKYDFYFYLNKALSRNFYRMFDKDKRMNDKDIIYKSGLYHRSKDNFASNNFEIDIFNLGLDGDEMIVLRSKMNDETKDMFTKNNPKFPMSRYYTCIKKIKNLLTSLKENDEL